MAVPAPWYIPIRAPHGRRVHALADQVGGRTVCGRSCSGWAIALARRARRVDRLPSNLGREVDFGAVLTCGGCRAELGLPPLHRAAPRRSRRAG